MKQVPLFSYTTIEFAPVIFLCGTNDRDWYSHRLIFFHGCSVWIFWKTFFSLPCLMDFLTLAVHIRSTGDCNVDISE